MSPKRAKTHQEIDSDPSDVGAQLKRRRTLRGQSLEAVHQHTRIPREHLEALESNNFDYFPASVYMRGFLRSYCEYLDIDCDPLIETIEQKEQLSGPEKDDTATSVGTGNSMLWLPFSESTLLPFLLIAGLVVTGGLLWSLKGRPSATPAQQGTAVQATQRRHASEYTVVIEALSTVSLSLLVDGEAAFEGRLHKEQAPSFTGRAFVLQTSNPNGLKVLVNGVHRPWSSLPATSKGVYPIHPGSS